MSSEWFLSFLEGSTGLKLARPRNTKGKSKSKSPKQREQRESRSERARESKNERETTAWHGGEMRHGGKMSQVRGFRQVTQEKIKIPSKEVKRVAE